MAVDLDDAFFPALWSLAISVGTRPEILLAVWLAESGLDPHAQNSIGCIGLNQTCPQPGGPGFPDDDGPAYRAMLASAQLAWIGPQVVNGARLNGGPFLSAARYYQSNFLPGTLTTAREPRAVIAAREGPYSLAYAANAQLDAGADGAITIEDLGRFVAGAVANAGPAWDTLLARVYAWAPPQSPWSSPALVIYEPGSSRPGAGLAVAAVVLMGSIGFGLQRARR